MTETVDEKKQSSPTEEEAKESAPTEEGQNSAGNGHQIGESPGEQDAEETGETDREEQSLEDQLQQELDELRAQYNDLHDKYLRLGAEFENYKKRTDREFTRRVQFANEDLFREVLPILDDLERAVNSTQEESSFEKLKEGVTLVYHNFKNVLKRRGVERVESVGEPFDPELHEAMMVRESEEHESQIVIEEFEKGYKMGDTVLRHAKVVVSK